MVKLETRLRRHVDSLAGDIGERSVWRYAQLQAAEAYIREAWVEMGLEPQAQTYAAMDRDCSNLEINLPGQTRPEEIILLGAHYDTVPGSPGADDNASGVAGLLEIAGALSSLKLSRTVRCVAFVNEEAPFFSSELMGSTVYAREGAAPQRRYSRHVVARNARLLPRRIRQPTLPAAVRPVLPKRRQLHRLRLGPRFLAYSAARAPRVSQAL